MNTVSTDRSGVSDDYCDVLFPGRCNTDAPGSFCVAIDATLGDRIEVQVEDNFQNLVTLDAGNMRDERTGAEVIGPEGGTVTFPEDERYEAFIPEDAFEEPKIVQVTPITDSGVGLDLFLFPVLTDPDPTKLEFVGAVLVEFEGIAARNLDVSVPAPPDADSQDQYIATRVIEFRGNEQLTMVDTAFFDPERQLVITDPSPFPGLVIGGTFGIQRAIACLGYVTGFVSIGDHFNAGYIPGGLTGAVLPAPIEQTGFTQFTVPLPCNHELEVSLLSLDDEVVDSIEFTVPDRALFDSLPRALTDDTKPPEVEGLSVLDQSVGVDPTVPLQAVFDEPIDPISVTPDTVTLRDGEGHRVSGRLEISADGRIVTFVPNSRLRLGEQYTLTIGAVRDLGGQVFAGTFTSTFTTFEPRILQHIADIDARDVTVLDPVGLGLPAGRRLIAVAEGDALRPDSQGGIIIYDVTDPASEPLVLASKATAGVDQSLVVAADGAVAVTRQGANVSFSGPFLMSVDGPGGPDRFGVWRLFDLSAFPEINQVAARFLNQSANSLARISGVDDPLAPPSSFSLSQLAAFVPNDVGVPLDVAAFGTEISYVANAPHIGLQAIIPQGMNADLLSEPQVHATLRGDPTESARSFPIRAVTTLRDPDPGKSVVLAVSQEGNVNKLLLVDPQLTGRSEHPLGIGGRPLAVTGLKAWPTRVREFGPTGEPAIRIENRDLAVVSCEGEGMCVLPLDVAERRVDPNLLEDGPGMLTTPGRGPRGAVGDRETQFLYAADGTAGLIIIDLAAPGGPTIDEDGDGVDDRVLGRVDLNGARARQVGFYRDVVGRPIVPVTTGADGVFLIQVGPAAVGLTAFDTNNVRIVAEEFEEEDGSFVLVNNDNDDGSADEDGAPILDKDDVGHVEGEDDLRRVDIAVPMIDGVLTIDMPEGASRARVWLSAERDGVLPLPQIYDLRSGELPPATIWVEGLAASAADRDVRLTYRWEPPPGVVLPPIDDAVSLTVIELDFFSGRHGPNGQASHPLGPRKTTFLKTEADELEEVLAGDIALDDLLTARFGGVRIRGIETGACGSCTAVIEQVTVRTTDESMIVGTNAPVLDETLPTDLTLETPQPRIVVSREDVMIYTGVVTVGSSLPGRGTPLTPEEVRDRFRPELALPLNTPRRSLPDTTVNQALVIRSLAGLHPPLIGGSAGPAAVEVIDAQAFREEVSRGFRGDDLYEAYLDFDASDAPQFTGMDGALADRWSRLIIQITLPATATETAFDFELRPEPPEDQALLGSNHHGDEDFPFGLLSLTGFEGFNADETAPSQVTPDGPTLDLRNVRVRSRGGRRVVVATFTPPGSFPFRTGGARLFQDLTLSFGPSGTADVWADHRLRLVRPPVLLVHGLMGSEEAFSGEYANKFVSHFIVDFVDYVAESLSGYDHVFSAIPEHIDQLLPTFRSGSVAQRSTRRGPWGSDLSDLDGKRIAATKVDVVGHSMGGLATRWFVTESLTDHPPQPRFTVYPSSAGFGHVEGENFPLLTTARPEVHLYRRSDNFMRGNIRNIVTTGSPQLGSPLANYVIHEVARDSRDVFTDSTRFGIITAALEQAGLIPSEARLSSNFGNALYDLAQGSSANALLQETPSEPVQVHAIASTKPDEEGRGTLREIDLLLLGMVALVHPGDPLPSRDFATYCSNFNETTSDLIVPRQSAIYGIRRGSRHELVGFSHSELNAVPDIAELISDGLLYDEPTNPVINSFDSAFPTGLPVPLECE